MRALQITRWHTDPELVEVDEPHAGPGQVVVRVGGAGVCHSDLHFLGELGDLLPWPLPFTLGHENAGWVHELGEGATGLEPGQAVAVYGAWGCGECGRCRIGLENYCDHPADAPPTGGLGGDGGMAEYLLVPSARHLVPLPDGLSPAQAAPLTDAGLTPYHAVRRSWTKLGPTSTAVVIGVGGLGHLAVQILTATTAATVVAVDVKKEALALADGAHHTVEAGELAALQIRELTGGLGADVVLDFVGSDDTLATARACVRPVGDLTIVGIAGGTLPYNFFALPYEVSVQSVYWGSRPRVGRAAGLGRARPGPAGDNDVPARSGAGGLPGAAGGHGHRAGRRDPEPGVAGLPSPASAADTGDFSLDLRVSEQAGPAATARPARPTIPEHTAL
jgi:propanol-preferring alcohol dehydrogenase